MKELVKKQDFCMVRFDHMQQPCTRVLRMLQESSKRIEGPQSVAWHLEWDEGGAARGNCQKKLARSSRRKELTI